MTAFFAVIISSTLRKNRGTVIYGWTRFTRFVYKKDLFFLHETDTKLSHFFVIFAVQVEKIIVHGFGILSNRARQILHFLASLNLK